MDDTFSEKARRIAQTIQEEEAAVRGEKHAPNEELASSEDEEEAEAEPSPSRSHNGKVKLVVAPPMPNADVEQGEEVPSLANPNAAMLFLKADMTDANDTWSKTFVDHAVQMGQPYPAITHCEMWIANYTLEHPSHWYGPSSLYLELATPTRMEAAYERERPAVKATVQEEELDRLADVLVQHSDDEVEAMRREDAHAALHTLAVHVLRAGSRTAADDEVDQDDFREAQERYARGLCRYTWTHRKNVGANK